MPKNPIARLLVVASGPLADAAPAPDDALLRSAGRIGRELAELLASRNGFYAFESALHVFHSGGEGLDLHAYNSPDAWRDTYDGMADGYLFFAEDVFGHPWGIRDDRIWAFDPETGEAEEVATSLKRWVKEILADYEVETGWPVGHAWQTAHGALPMGKRLPPLQPFVTGGEYEADNVRPVDTLEAMRFRGSLATQIRDLPDGAQIRIVVED